MSRTKTAERAFNALIRHRIRIVMAVDNVKGPALARASKMSRPTFSNVMCNPNQSPKMDQVARLALALEFSLDAILGPRSLFARAIGKRVSALA
jgi:hypothetical protein